MRFKFSLYLRSTILLLLISFTALLASVDASVIPSAAWSNLKSTVLASSNGPIRLWQLLDTYNTSPDFWERAANLGSLVQQYTSDILNDAAISYATAAGKIDCFKQSMNHVVSNTGELRREIERKARARGMTLHNISEMLSNELAVVIEELKNEFPPPDHAEHHEDRVKIISRALVKVEDAVVRVSKAVGVPEAKVRSCFGDIEIHLRDVLVVTGDLAEQHPIILETLAFSVAILVLPESALLKPIIRIFGIGPAGPIKGSPATWAQRRFFGGVIPKGSWFSRLQSAAMKAGPSPGAWKGVWGSIGLGVGLSGSLFGGCMGRSTALRVP